MIYGHGSIDFTFVGIDVKENKILGRTFPSRILLPRNKKLPLGT